MSEAARIPDDVTRRAAEAEQHLLGGIIGRGSKAFAAAAAAGLTSSHFAVMVHATIWSVFEEAVAVGDRPNGIEAFRRIKAEGREVTIYWSKLATSYPYVADRDVEFLAANIIDEWRRRAAWAEVAGVLVDLKGEREAAKETIERHIARLQDVVARDVRAGSRQIGDIIASVVEQADAAAKGEAPPPGLPTGFEAIDELLGGLEPGNMVVLGARPAMGKTALAAGIAVNAARTGRRVAIFSLEMTRAEMALRFLSMETRIPMHAIKRGRLSRDDWRDLVIPAQQRIAAMRIEIDDRPGLRMTEIEATARTMGRDLSLIVIDHLGLVGAPEGSDRAGLVERTAKVSNSCKRLAKALNVPVLALAQLSRQNEQRDEKRPMLSDLRWAGEIEQDADVVMFLHRPEYYARQREDEAEIAATAGKAEVIIAKNRNGSTGPAELQFEARAARFSNVTEAHR